MPLTGTARDVDVAYAANELRTAIRLLKRRLHVDDAADGPTPPQRAVLSLLADRGPMTPSELAAAERVRPQSMGENVAALERAGLVERRRHPHDGRRVLMSLTGAGRAVVRRGRDARQRWLVETIGTVLDEGERRALIDALALLRRIAEA